MSLWDFLKRNKKDAFQQYADNMQPLQPLPTVQMNEDGSSYTVENPQPMNRNRGIGLRNRLANFLLGESATPTDNANVQDGVLNVTVSENPRVGGFIPDITSGMRENFTTGFAAPNLFDDTTSDGRKKRIAYRLGEGLGTAGRFLESAPGRALLTAGAVGLAGGNGADMLAYGIQGGALNNRLRTQDRMYRDEMLRNAQNSLRNSPEFNNLSNEEQQTIYNQLLTNPDGTMKNYNTMTDAEKQKFNSDLRDAYTNRLYQNQQEQLNNVANNINGMHGYVTNDVYNNFVTAQQLRDNADWKRLYFDSQQEQNRIMNGLRQDQLEYQKMKAAEDREFKERQLASDNYYKNANLGLGYARIAADRENKYNKQLEKQYEKQELINGTLNQLNVLMDLHKKLPQNYVPFGSKKLTAIGSGLLNKAGLPNDDMAAFNGAANIVTNMIARKIGGEKGVMTDRDFDRAKAMTPNIYDTPSQAQAKVKAIYALMGVPYGKGGSKNNNPLGLKL